MTYFISAKHQILLSLSYITISYIFTKLLLIGLILVLSSADIIKGLTYRTCLHYDKGENRIEN